MDRAQLKVAFPRLYRVYYVATELRKALFRFYDQHYTSEHLKALLQGFPALDRGNFALMNNLMTFLNHRARNARLFAVDVGANDGWFARTFFRFAAGPARVVSYEPLHAQQPALRRVKDKFGDAYDYYQLAIGRRPGEAVMHEYATSGLSSLREFDPAYHYSNHYDMNLVNSYRVEVTTLTREFNRLSLLGAAPADVRLLKVDTQGYELDVLDGARQLFERKAFAAVMIERMSRRKYQGAASFFDVFAFFAAFDFTIFDIHNSYREPNGQLSEFDVVLVQRSLLEA